jgi:nitroreductase
MEAYQAILTRRSVRSYTSQPVPESLIRELLAAAMSAPSASNEQPWHFIVITERGKLDQLAAGLPHGKMLAQAPLALVVCGDLQLQTNAGCWVQDCSAATQNILLAAHAKGLGGVWLGIHPRRERVAKVRRLLGLPAHVVPLSGVSLGYPAQISGEVDRYRADRVHHDQW